MFLLLHMLISLANPGGNSRKEDLVPCRCSSTDTAWHYPAWNLTGLLLGMLSVQKESLFGKLYLETKEFNVKGSLVSAGAG